MASEEELFEQFMHDEAREIISFMQAFGRDDTEEAAREWIWSRSEKYKQQWYADHS